MNAPLSQIADLHLIRTTQNSTRPTADHAFEMLITRHASPVHAHVAHRIRPDADSVDDLMQIVRLRAWNRLRRSNPLILTTSQVTGEPSFQPFLLKIAHNVVLDYFSERNEQHANEESLEAAGEHGGVWRLVTTEPAVDRGTAMVGDLRRGLARLASVGALGRRQERPAPHRAQLALMRDYARDGRSTEYAAATLVHGPCCDAFILAAFQELRQHEIATKLGIPIGTVGAQIAEGRRQYEAAYALLLWEEGETEDDIARRFARIHWKEEGASTAEMARRVAVEAQRVPLYLEHGRKLRARFLRRAEQGGGLASDQ